MLKKKTLSFPVIRGNSNEKSPGPSWQAPAFCSPVPPHLQEHLWGGINERRARRVTKPPALSGHFLALSAEQTVISFNLISVPPPRRRSDNSN